MWRSARWWHGIKDFRRDERGMILSAELIMVVTLVVIGLVTGLACVQQAVNAELQDVGAAIRGMNQSYATTGFLGCGKFWGRTSFTAGSRFTDFHSGLLVGGPMGVAEIGAGRGGLILDAPAAPAPVREATPVCPPAPTTLTPAPCDLPPAASIPMLPPVECQHCPPAPAPAIAPFTPIPEIPQGPAPQVLPQG
jgi:Flp pilus assembly pilin Flp